MILVPGISIVSAMTVISGMLYTGNLQVEVEGSLESSILLGFAIVFSGAHLCKILYDIGKNRGK